MYKCYDCGATFEEDEIKEWAETHGLDTPPYQLKFGCPVCLGAFARAEECEICGEYTFIEDLYSGVCEKCAEEVEKDVNLCRELCDEADLVEINMAISSAFTPAEIESILAKHMVDNGIDCSEWVKYREGEYEVAKKLHEYYYKRNEEAK